MLTKATYFSTKIFPWLVCFIAALFYCYEFILRVAPTVMSFDIMKYYKIGAGEFAILVAFYGYAYTPMQLLVGVLMDHYGPRKLICLSILSCIAGAFLISINPSFISAKIGMFAMGFGSAFSFIAVLKLAVNWLPDNKLSLVSGIATTLGLLGGIFAESIVSQILHFMDWQHVWYYFAFIGIFILIITFLFVYDHPKYKLDHVENIPEVSWKQLFIDLKLIFKNYKFLINGLIGCVLYLPISVFGGMWAIPFFEQAAYLSHGTAANIAPLIFFGMALGGPIAGLLSEYIGRRKILFQISLVLSFIVFLIIIYMPFLPVYILGSLLFILGLLAGAQVLVFVVGIELTSKEISGTATAGTNFLVMISLIILQPVIGNLLEYTWDGKVVNDIPFYTLEGYQFAFILMPICYVLVFISSFFLTETHPHAKIKKLVAKEKLFVLNK